MFVFHPELFDAKTRAQEALTDGGIMWLTDYSSCDLLHEEYGLEVEGLPDEKTAREALQILRRTFPEWKLGTIWYRDYLDTRWCTALCKLRCVRG